MKAMAGGIVTVVFRALSRARLAILIVALAYLLSVAAGIIMVHTGNAFALANRDRIVGSAQSSPILVALDSNRRLQAALLDFAGNLFGTLSASLAGLGVIFPFPLVIYRSWIGGIVSVDGMHLSRLADSHEAVYYLVTLILQLLPSILGTGAGVNLGLSLYRPRDFYQGPKWLGVSREGIKDFLRIYLLVVPLSLLASLFEFVAR
jgi:hypothetical protein